jgi:hypothetical protein
MLVDDMFPYELFSLEFFLADSALINTFLHHVSFVIAEVIFALIQPRIQVILNLDGAILKKVLRLSFVLQNEFLRLRVHGQVIELVVINSGW